MQIIQKVQPKAIALMQCCEILYEKQKLADSVLFYFCEKLI